MDDLTRKKIISAINKYYTAKVIAHGPSPAGMDWNGRESQYTRFEQLAGIFSGPAQSIACNDLGCGHGEFLNYLISTGFAGIYRGYDISQEMISCAQKEHRAPNSLLQYAFYLGNAPEVSQYTVASGIFNVKCEIPDASWQEYILETIATMDASSTKGFAFNILTSYSDIEYRRAHLYYADPCFFFDHCKKNYSRNVALIHDYNLYEFTVLVRK